MNPLPGPCSIDSNHLAWLDGIGRTWGGWDQALQVGKAVGGRAQNEDRNPPLGEILLVGNPLIRGDRRLETS